MPKTPYKLLNERQIIRDLNLCHRGSLSLSATGVFPRCKLILILTSDQISDLSLSLAVVLLVLNAASAHSANPLFASTHSVICDAEAIKEITNTLVSLLRIGSIQHQIKPHFAVVTVHIHGDLIAGITGFEGSFSDFRDSQSYITHRDNFKTALTVL